MTKIKRSREMLDAAMLVINNSTDEPFKANVESAIVLLEVYTWGTSETPEEGGLPSRAFDLTQKTVWILLNALKSAGYSIGSEEVRR